MTARSRGSTRTRCRGSPTTTWCSSPDPASAPEIHDGATISQNDTYSFVSLDQLFNTLTPKTRTGFAELHPGRGRAISGKAPQANETLQYFSPALSSTTNVTEELTRNEPLFDSLLVQGAQTLRALGSRTDQLTQLVANTNATTAAIASQSQNLEQALSQLGPTLTHSTATFAGSALDA